MFKLEKNRNTVIMFIKNILNIVLFIGLLESCKINCQLITAQKSEEWTNLLLDLNQNNLYAAGKNVLKIFDLNLTVVKETSTFMDDYNKILLIGGSEDKLIACGTNNETACQIRDPISLEILTKSETKFRVVTTNMDKSAIGIIGVKDKDTMFVGNSFDVKFINNAQVNVYPLSYNGIFSVSLQQKNAFNFSSCISINHCSAISISLTINDMYYVSTHIVGGFVYFFKNRLISQNNKIFQSSIARVCENDQNYMNSYFEMPIRCNGLTKITAVTVMIADSNLSTKINTTSNETIFVMVFEDSTNSRWHLCPIGVSKLSEIFTLSKKTCTESKLFYQQDGEITYPCQDLNIPDNFCGGLTDSPRSSMISTTNLTTNSLIELNVNITSVLSFVGEGASLIFIGSNNGSVAKLDLNAPSMSLKSLYIGTTATNPTMDLKLTKDSNYIFWRTDTQIYRSAVTDCENYENCNECLSPPNPLCGWCTLDNKCTRRTKCSQFNLEKRWIPSYGNKSDCPIYRTDVDIEVTINDTLMIGVDNFPVLPSDLQMACSFSNISSTSVDLLPGNPRYFSCKIPDLLGPYDGSHNGTLILKITNTNVDLFKQEFIIYRCTSIQACSACAKMRMCYFDVIAYSCTTSISGKICPKVVDISSKINTGATTSIEFQLENVQGLQLTNTRCWIPSVNVTLSTINNNNIYACSPYTFTTSKDFENVEIFILFGANNSLSGSINVEVYNCNEISKDDCSLCMSKSLLYSQYNCTWCGNQCLYQSCTNNINNSVQVRCPFPINIQVSPSTGPKEGNTIMTIVGKELGWSSDEVEVNIGTSACVLVKELYLPSKRVVCKTPPFSGSPIDAPLNVGLKINGVGENVSVATFTYTVVKVTGMYPVVGPEAGGTLVSLFGMNLLTSPGTVVDVRTQDNVSLPINRNNSNASQIIFTTPNGGVGNILKITTIQIDGFVTSSLDFQFTFTNNPSIKDYQLAIFKRAGCNLTISGSNLNVSSSSSITFWDCATDNQIVLTIYPNSTNIEITPPQNFDCQELKAILKMDNWSTSLTIKRIEEPKITIIKEENSIYILAISDDFPDFKFSMNGNDIFLYSKTYDNLISKVELKNDLINCSSLRAFDNNIICEFKGNPGDGVQVSYCNNSFKLAFTKQNDTPVWQTALGVSLGLLVVVLVVVCTALLIKYFQSKRKYKKLMMDINVMEQEARNQMKEAFAKLQTSEVGVLEGDDNGADVPFNPYRIYAYRILYPRERDDHVLHTKRRIEKYEHKNQCLTQLLNSKFFFVNFVRVLERNKDIDQKSKIGSYLGLFLLDKMDYAAQVVTALLNHRIDGFISSGKNLKLMMRSGDTVVERLMSTWLSLTMYRHLTGTTGRSLYELHVAIKRQVYSGPVDVCTNEAKFTLSEGFFLKDYKFNDDQIVVVTIVNSDNVPITCKLLLCDAISQAKDKIYDKYFNGVSLQKRISPDKYDLIWRRGADDMVKLHDEDGNMESMDDNHHNHNNTNIHHHNTNNNNNSNDVARVRTLGSYGITTGSSLLLQRRTTEADESQAQILGDETLALFNGLPSLYPITVKMPQRRYHLVDKVELENKAGKGKIFFTEMYYPLLQTKVALEDNINKLFNEILRVHNDGNHSNPNNNINNNNLPPSVKFLFDFFDDSLAARGITDQDLAKLWKRDSYILRVWVNLIQNPYFLLDIPRNTVVDVNMAVIGQALVDSCSPQEKKLNKDSPTSTLLFAKNHKDFRPLVKDFYEKIQNHPRLSEAQFMKIMESTYSRDINFNIDFNLETVLAELYEFAKNFKEEILIALDEDESSKNLRLVQKFQFLFNIE